jgi:hypothetical protein
MEKEELGAPKEFFTKPETGPFVPFYGHVSHYS